MFDNTQMFDLLAQIPREANQKLVAFLAVSERSTGAPERTEARLLETLAMSYRFRGRAN